MNSASKATPRPRPKSSHGLFLGDLSIFCCEKDIENAFAKYGHILSVRIQRSKEDARALSYGFIEFASETAAVTAMNEMNGFVLIGRPLRIRWAADRNQPVKSENPGLHTAATIFVKFASQMGIIVSEALLREHFSVYGEILDITIRTITVYEENNSSKGYGFVNFINDESQDGLVVAYRAAEELQNVSMGGVNYRCEVGHKHKDKAKGRHATSSKAGSDAMSMSAYSSNYAAHPLYPPGGQAYYGQQLSHQQPYPSQMMPSSGSSVTSNNTHHSFVPTGVSAGPDTMQKKLHASVAQVQYTPAQLQQYMLMMQQHQYTGPGSAGHFSYAQQAVYNQHMHQPQQVGGLSNYYMGPAYDPQYFEQQYYANGGYFSVQSSVVSQSQSMSSRQAAGASQPYMHHPQQVQQNGYFHQQQYRQQKQQPQAIVDTAQPSSGRRSQRNVSNQSNISEITSYTLSDTLDGDDAEESAEAERTDQQAAANAAAMISELNMDSQDDVSLLSKSPPARAAVIAVTNGQLNNPFLSQSTHTNVPERRKRNVSTGTNTTEITAQVLFDLQQQERLLTQDEDESSNPATPKSRSLSAAPAFASANKTASSGIPVRSPRISENKGQYSIPPSDTGALRTRESSAASIAPFTMSADALEELQKQAEQVDMTAQERRSRRNNTECTTRSDVTVSLGFSDLDLSSAEPALHADTQDDQE